MSKDTSLAKFSRTEHPTGFSTDTCKVWENSLSSNDEVIFRKIPGSGTPDPDVDDFQNLTSSSFSKDIFLVKFSQRFDQQFLLKLLDRQKERQTDKRRIKRNLLGRCNNLCTQPNVLGCCPTIHHPLNMQCTCTYNKSNNSKR